MSIFRTGWYLVYTRPQHEKKVYARFAESGINGLLPLTRRLRTSHNRKRYVDEPLFPSYVFVYLEDLQSYYTVMDIEGVVYYVRTGKEIARVNESTINNIRLLIENVDCLEVSGNSFQEGQRLLISQGPLKGLSCEMIKFSNRQVILVRVELLKRNILVSLPAGQVMAYKESPANIF